MKKLILLAALAAPMANATEQKALELSGLYIGHVMCINVSRSIDYTSIDHMSMSDVKDYTEVTFSDRPFKARQVKIRARIGKLLGAKPAKGLTDTLDEQVRAKILKDGPASLLKEVRDLGKALSKKNPGMRLAPAWVNTCKKLGKYADQYLG